MVEKVKALVATFYKQRFMRYVFIGGTTLIIQIGLGLGLNAVFHINRGVSVLIAYWVSVIYNFILNRWWTFSVTDTKNLHKHALAYGLLLIFNYGATHVIADKILHNLNLGIAIAIASLVQLTWNYFIYKNFIFTTKSHETTSDEQV